MNGVLMIPDHWAVFSSKRDSVVTQSCTCKCVVRASKEGEDEVKMVFNGTVCGIAMVQEPPRGRIERAPFPRPSRLPCGVPAVEPCLEEQGSVPRYLKGALLSAVGWMNGSSSIWAGRHPVGFSFGSRPCFEHGLHGLTGLTT